MPLTAWTEPATLNAATLEQLLAGTQSHALLPDFLPRSDCAAAAKALLAGAPLRPYSGHPEGAGLQKVGPVQCEYAPSNRAAYFAAAASMRAQASHAAVSSLVGRIAALLARLAHTDVAIATDPAYGLYFAGATHAIDSAAMGLHMDYAPYDAAGWSIEAVQTQLSCVLHLQPPRSGGATCVYRRLWHPDDASAHGVAGSYAYNPRVVDGAERCTIAFQPGALVLFNSRHYHEVLASTGVRLTISVFAGRTADGRLVLWS